MPNSNTTVYIYTERESLELGAIYNTRCTKCGGKGHISIECFNSSKTSYDLIPDDDEDNRAPNKTLQITSPPVIPVGRGRGAVLPSWMTEDDKLIGKKNKRSKDDTSKKHSEKYNDASDSWDDSRSSTSSSEHEKKKKKHKHKHHSKKHKHHKHKHKHEKRKSDR
jgi:hypothetical protein